VEVAVVLLVAVVLGVAAVVVDVPLAEELELDPQAVATNATAPRPAMR
jgi:hypothetical protein